MLSDAVPVSLIRPDESGLLAFVIAMTGATESSFLQRTRSAWSVGDKPSVDSSAPVLPPPQPMRMKAVTAWVVASTA
jgi:hypothetical protein